ncbi:hypothetical protein ACLOJK_000092 [Asimina triloba]
MRHPKPRRGSPATVRKTSAVGRLNSPGSTRCYFYSSGNSPYSSPVPLKCRPAHLPQLPNKTLDLYIDGEQHERNLRCKNEHKKGAPVAGSCCLLDNQLVHRPRQPPRVLSTAPASPANDRDHWRLCSCGKGKDTCLCRLSRDWRKDVVGPVSPRKLARNVVENLSHVFPQGLKVEQVDFNSETTGTTVEDIYEDHSESHPAPQSYCFTQPDSDCHPSEDPDAVANGYCRNEILDPDDYPVGMKHKNPFYSVKKEEYVDAELRRKAKEAEQRVMLLSEDIDQVDLQNGDDNISTLLQVISDITDDRRILALEVSAQIKSRIAERASASEAIKCSQVELDTWTRRLEREKNEVQAHLEKELERRSSDWSSKLESYQSEEQRLRERVRELAEQNVSLQREVASFSSRDAESRSRVMSLDMQLNEAMARLEEGKAENTKLSESLLQLQDYSKGVEADRGCIKRNYNEKLKENKELQKAITRLQRICGEQEKTISGLRQGISDDICDQSTQKVDVVAKLQMEQVRLTGVEQMLRRELESCGHEVESLRHENINLLGRLQNTGNCPVSTIKLDQELCTRVDSLQKHSLSLLDDSGQLCSKLLEFVKENTYLIPELPSSEAQEVQHGFDGYSIMEYDMRFQSFLRGVKNLKRSLQISSAIVQEKANLDASKSERNVNEIAPSGQSLNQASELWSCLGKVQSATDCKRERSFLVGKVVFDAELELQSEILITKVLREKLFFKELEIEQLQAELATSVRGHDILRSQIQRSQDTISCLAHKMKDLELQALRKDENINQLQSDFQECMKELSITRSILQKVSVERDLMWEEVKQYSEKTMLLNSEVNSLKKKIEALDEDILLKEGQITILKDSLASKPFDLLPM